MAAHHHSRNRTRREMLYDDPVDSAVYTLAKDRAAPDLTRTVSHVVRGTPPLAIFALFDGHGAATAAELCARNFVPTLLDDPRLHAAPERALAGALEALEAFVLAKSALDRAYYGCTALVALVRGPTLYVANLGNSRAVLSSRDGARRLTDDHSAANAAEVARVEAAGAFFSHGRVNGLVRVTRSIGDLELKTRKHVTFPHLRFTADVLVAAPDIFVRPLRARDHFVILATPHVWDRLADVDAVAVVRDALRRRETPRAAAKKLAVAAAPGADGPLSVMVLVFAPHLAPEHAPREKSMLAAVPSHGAAAHHARNNHTHFHHGQQHQQQHQQRRRRAHRSPALKRHSSDAETELRARARTRSAHACDTPTDPLLREFSAPLPAPLPRAALANPPESLPAATHAAAPPSAPSTPPTPVSPAPEYEPVYEPGGAAEQRAATPDARAHARATPFGPLDVPPRRRPVSKGSGAVREATESDVEDGARGGQTGRSRRDALDVAAADRWRGVGGGGAAGEGRGSDGVATSGGAGGLSVLSDVTGSGATGGDASQHSLGDGGGSGAGHGAHGGHGGPKRRGGSAGGDGGGDGAGLGARGAGAGVLDCASVGPSKVRYRDDGTVQHGKLGFLHKLGHTFVRRK